MDRISFSDMKERININPDISVNEEEYLRLLGYPNNYKPEGKPRELADWARQWYNENGKPWVYTVPSGSINFTNGKLLIDSVELSSKKLLKQFADTGSENAMLVAVSAGEECEKMSYQLWQEGKPDEYFFLEVFGSAVVEHLITKTGYELCEWGEQNEYAVLPHYSPGYSGWMIEDQNRLMQLIKQKNKTLSERISVLQTGMLKPKKSLLAVFGLTKNLDRVKDLRGLIPCETCSLHSCQYRRLPFKYSRNPIEDVGSLQPSGNKNVDYAALLTQNAKYTVSTKALEKWSQEKLELKIYDDNSVEAKFRYEGSTCSNMGRSLLFDYHIKLSPPEEDYKITYLSCNPIDDSYQFMCEYIKAPDQLMETIENEKPFLGRPLNDIIEWKRQFSPQGCYCNPESREHKWGLVFEVLHYALTRYENEKSKNNNNATLISQEKGI